MPRFNTSMWLRSFALALLAGGFWALWAYFVNREIISEGLRAAVTQGTVSFAMTFVFAALVEWSYALGGRPALRYLRTIVIPSGVIALLLPLAHWWQATPNITITVLPPILLAAVYCGIYVMARQRTASEV